MFTKFDFALVLVACYLGVIHGYSDCGSEVGEIISVDISGCDNTKRCILKRNTNVSLELSFKTKVDTDVVKAVVHGIILGVPMPFELPNDNGCKESDITCPIKAGDTLKYKTIMPISTNYPRVTVDVKWELQDKDGKDLICAMIPSKIG